MLHAKKTGGGISGALSDGDKMQSEKERERQTRELTAAAVASGKMSEITEIQVNSTFLCLNLAVQLGRHEEERERMESGEHKKG